jgi:hypothetical protein
LVALGPGVARVARFGVGAGLGEHWPPLKLRGFEGLGAALAAFGVRGLSALVDSPPG